MRLALEQLNLRGLDFRASGEPAPHQVVVREGDAVRGELIQGEGKLTLRDVAVKRLVLDVLRLTFGALTLRSEVSTTFHALEGELTRSLAHMQLSLRADAVHADPLELRVEQLTIGAETELHDVVLTVGQDGGSLKAARVKLTQLSVAHPNLAMGPLHLSAREFEFGWGVQLRLSIAELELSELSLKLLSGAELTLHGVRCTGLALRGARFLSLGGLEVRRASYKHAFAALEPGSVPASEITAPPAKPVKAFDLALLNGLSGSLQVDAHVDMTIPIFGTRRAKHKLRLTVDRGTVDYRELESDLAPLESSLLDFSVRGDELVLERGIPLLPTRGFGKPILRWQLSPADQALAEQSRVRLALLPRYQPASGAKAEREAGEEEAPSKLALRKLTLSNIDLQLMLEPQAVPGLSLQAVAIEHFSAQGSVAHHVGDEHAAGAVTGGMRGLSLRLEELSLGARTLSALKLHVGRMPRWLVRFSGLTPSAVELELEQVTLSDLTLT